MDDDKKTKSVFELVNLPPRDFDADKVGPLPLDEYQQRIATLKAENERLRGALEEIVLAVEAGIDPLDADAKKRGLGGYDRARQALSPTAKD